MQLGVVVVGVDVEAQPLDRRAVPCHLVDADRPFAFEMIDQMLVGERDAFDVRALRPWAWGRVWALPLNHGLVAALLPLITPPLERKHVVSMNEPLVEQP